MALEAELDLCRGRFALAVAVLAGEPLGEMQGVRELRRLGLRCGFAVAAGAGEDALAEGRVLDFADLGGARRAVRGGRGAPRGVVMPVPAAERQDRQNRPDQGATHMFHRGEL